MKNVTVIAVSVALLVEAGHSSASKKNDAPAAETAASEPSELFKQFLKAVDTSKPYETKLAVHCYNMLHGV